MRDPEHLVARSAKIHIAAAEHAFEMTEPDLANGLGAMRAKRRYIILLLDFNHTDLDLRSVQLV